MNRTASMDKMQATTSQAVEFQEAFASSSPICANPTFPSFRNDERLVNGWLIAGTVGDSSFINFSASCW
jgi:hypothetical protein